MSFLRILYVSSLWSLSGFIPVGHTTGLTEFSCAQSYGGILPYFDLVDLRVEHTFFLHFWDHLALQAYSFLPVERSVCASASHGLPWSTSPGRGLSHAYKAQDRSRIIAHPQYFPILLSRRFSCGCRQTAHRRLCLLPLSYLAPQFLIYLSACYSPPGFRVSPTYSEATAIARATIIDGSTRQVIAKRFSSDLRLESAQADNVLTKRSVISLYCRW